MITTKYSYKQLKHAGKKIKLYKNVRQYSIDAKQLSKLKQNEKQNHLYAYKFFGIEYRKKLCEKLIKKYNFNEHELTYLATYILDADSDKKYILSSKKIKGINRFEIPFEFGLGEDFDEDSIESLDRPNIQYNEKNTKLYKIMQLDYDFASWEIVDTDNFFIYGGHKFMILDKHKEYEVGNDNVCDMDKVFCITKNGTHKFFNQNIEGICVVQIY